MAKLTKKQRAENEERQRRGYHILWEYRDLHDTGEPFETVLGDLLADLMHIAKSKKMDFDLALQAGQMNYKAEINGED